MEQDCDCTVEAVYYMHFCPLHTAAGQLFEALRDHEDPDLYVHESLEDLAELLEHRGFPDWPGWLRRQAEILLCAAIAAAEGESSSDPL